MRKLFWRQEGGGGAAAAASGGSRASLDKPLLGADCAGESGSCWTSRSWRWFRRGYVCCMLFGPIVPIIPFIWDYWYFIRYARGSQWDYFVWCLVNPTTGLSCPPSGWDSPPGGCGELQLGGAALPGGSGEPSHILLTADGLSSPQTQGTFDLLLRRAAAVREEILLPNGTVVKKARHHKKKKKKKLLGDRGVVYVCDAEYDANIMSPDGFLDCVTYCGRRQEELEALGASKVACLVLDEGARVDLTNTTAGKLPDLAYNFTDQEMADLLHEAVGVFVEGGGTLFLLKALWRPLELEGGARPSFGELVRARVAERTLAYVGVSAGSIVAGETASVARIWSDRGADALGWNFTALRLVSRCAFLPHFAPRMEDWMWEYAEHLRAGTSVDPPCPGCGVMGVPQCQPLIWGAYSEPRDEQLWQLQYLCPT